MTTETTCHCGHPFRGSDHCGECGCEQFEATCDHVWPAAAKAQDVADACADAFFWAVTRPGTQDGEDKATFSFEAEGGQTFTVTVRADG